MLRRLIAVALLAGAVALPACAQRGGGARGGSVGRSGGFAGHSGGFSSGSFANHSGGLSGGSFAIHSTPALRSSAPAFRSSAPAFRSGFAPTSRGSFMGAPQVGGNRTLRAVPAFRGGPVRNGFGVGGRRPGYGADRYRRSYVRYSGFGFPYGISGWVDTNYPGYFGSSLYDSPYGYGDPASAAAPPAAVYPATGSDVPPVEQAQAAPQSSFRPAYQRPQPEPTPESAVTLVFRDGRPAEQIHNYILTRTTLYVQEERLREIAVADLDLAATAKLNREAGVDFRLPDSGR